MLIEWFSWAAVAVIFLASAIMMSARDWRAGLGALGVQYLAAFFLLLRHLPFIIGSAKLITGWMVIAVLGMTKMSILSAEETQPRASFFGVLFAGIAALVSAGASVRVEAFIPGLGLPVVAGSLLLMAVGVFHLSLHTQILDIVLGLLTLLAGFDVMYAAVENSALVASLLAVITLGLGLTGAYLLTAGALPHPSEEGDAL